MSYAVRTDLFEGPFDLLLRLITEQRVELYDLRLADIVDAYLGEIAEMEHLDLEIATEFLLIAAILVELKSRRLLPQAGDDGTDDDIALIEERDYLLARLVECTTFSAAGRRLAELERLAARSVGRTAGSGIAFEAAAVDLLAGVDAEDLRAAASRALAERPRAVVEVEHILVDEVTVAEVASRLATVLEDHHTASFRELCSQAASRIEKVVHFLALLELYKHGLVELDQLDTFGEITVTWLSIPSVELEGLLVGAEYRG